MIKSVTKTALLLTMLASSAMASPISDDDYVQIRFERLNLQSATTKAVFVCNFKNAGKYDPKNVYGMVRVSPVWHRASSLKIYLRSKGKTNYSEGHFEIGISEHEDCPEGRSVYMIYDQKPESGRICITPIYRRTGWITNAGVTVATNSSQTQEYIRGPGLAQFNGYMQDIIANDDRIDGNWVC